MIGLLTVCINRLVDPETNQKEDSMEQNQNTKFDKSLEELVKEFKKAVEDLGKMISKNEDTIEILKKSAKS